MRRQNIIIFSSGKNRAIAHAVARSLDASACKPVVWDEFFRKIYGDEYSLTKHYALFPFLIKKIPSFDYAIIIAGDDDTMQKNGASGERYVTAWDNVIFELGLSSMALGDKRVVMVRHRSVRLIDDLRGFGGTAQLRIKSGEIGYEDTLLSAGNTQINVFDYESEGDIPTIGRQVSGYVRETCDSYSPVVVGAACSTAIGYKDNFLIPLIKSFRSLADVGQVRGPEEDRMAFYDLLRDGTNVEIRLLMPYAETRTRFPEALEDPCGFLARRVYVAEGMCPDCKVLGNSRSISFCCRVEGPRVVIYDLPTTLLASQRTASRILEIEADDAIERGHLDRLMDKEIDQFEATLRRFLPADGEGRLYASTEDAHGRRYSFVFRDLLDYVR